MKTLHTIYTNFAKRMVLVLTLLLTHGVTTAWAAVETVDFSQQGYENGSAVSSYTGTGFSVSFAAGTNSNAPKYYSSGTAIRCYGGNKFTVTSTSNITKVVITFGSSDGSNAISTNVNSYSSGTWEGTSKSITFTIGGTSGNRRIQKLSVTYESGYSVTYNNGGRGTAPSNTTASSVKLSAITATGYTNTGWKADVAVKNGSNTISAGTLINNGTTVTLTQATTFTAQWQANKYTITLNNQSADISGTTSITATYNSNANLITNITIPQKNYHDFGGYYTQTNGNGTQLIDSEGKFKAGVSGYTDADKIWKYANNITLYAKWTEKSLVRYRTSCACIPPAVTIQPTSEYGWRYSIGETIGLKAIVEGASGDCTYQWQKYVVDQWQDIAGATSETFTKENCTTNDGGSYRCVVNAGNDCIAESEPYYVRVFTLNGYYYNEEIAANKIEWTGENTGVATIHLGQSRTYLFKVTDNEGRWFGYGDYAHFNYIVQPWQADCGIETGNGTNTDIRLFTGPEGDYTFTINIEHALDNEPYVNIAVAYPEVEHPVAGYGYITKWWDNCYIHWWDNNDQALTEWGSDAQITTYTEICETEYYYFPIIDNYINLIIKDAAGDPSNTTGNQTQTGHSGWYITHDGNSWGWHEFATYTITFDANGGNGTMDALSGICPTTDKTLTTNAFTRSGYTFAGWKANKNVTINGVSVVAGTLITDCATIQNIVSDITLIAQWTPKNITITWDANGGSVNPTTSTYTYNGTPVELPIPTRANYTFNGWFTAATGGEKITEVGTTNKPAADVTYYAHWTAKATPTFEWSAATCTAALEAVNTFPTLNNPNSLSPVTYESSNTGVATIDADGNITLVATGTTTITATGAETATHKSATTTYKLTVVESNCRWVEVEIGDITYGDDVLIAVPGIDATSGDAILNMLQDPQAATNPTIRTIKVIDLLNGTNVPTTVIWNIRKRDDNQAYFTVYRKGSNTDRLAFMASEYNVRVGSSASIDSIFTITNEGYLKSILRNAYLKKANNDWRYYTTGGQTLKFYKRECLDASKVWIEGNLTNVTCTPQLPQQLAKDGSITLTFEATDEYALPTSVNVKMGATTLSTTSWDRGTGKLTINAPTGGFTDNVLVTVEAVELHTITWMVGSNSVKSEKVENGNPITLTPDNPANNAIGECADTFMGWTETPLGSAEGQSAPTDLCTAAQMKTKHSSVNSDKTFYAVFATKEGGEDYLQISNESDLVAGSKYLIVGNSSSTYRALPVDNASNLTYVYPSSSKISNPADGLIWTLEGAADRWKIKSASNNKYLQITGGALTFVENTTFTFSVSVSSSKFTFTSSASSGNKVLSYYHNGNCFNAYTTANNVYIYKQDIDYSNYVTNCCALAPATNLTVSATTANSATLTWTAPSPTTGITKLQVRNAETDAVVVDNIDVNTTTATITELEECTSYQYYVVSVGECEVVSNTVIATPFSGAKTVNYDYNGGTGSLASFTTSCENQKIVLPNATRPGYTFNGWYDLASGGNYVGGAGAEYTPATSPITLYAQWTETNYTLTHSGSNYTNTQNKTTIKSSETPLTLNYTCTGDYGLPATISITGGGKSWTVGTDYTWEVAADRQSAILVIKETVISANVTITINVATRYTVTFIHNDKGVFSGSETIEVLSSENTITLPTVTDVSCGFYGTFEGWIISNSEYVESTTKPTMVYSGGASYKVTGDCTFRALYSKCEGDATQVYRKVTTTGDVTDGTYILVANTATPRVYSGYGGATYGSSVEGLTADGEDFSTTLPVDAKPITVTTGTGTSAGTFAMYNADRNKYLTYTGSSNTLDESDSKVFIWKLTDGSDVSSRSCPAGVLTPNGFDTRVLQCNTSSSNRFACYTNNASFPHVFLYKLISKCTKYYSTNPSCEKPVGVHIVYNANAVDASMSCSTQDRTYKVENDVNKYPQLASQLQFCTNATREGYTLVGWNTQSNGQGTTYNINQNYYNLPVSGELDGDKWITLNLYAMWKPCIKFNLGNATGGTGVPDAVVENGGCVLPTPTAEQLGTIPCAYEFYAWSETSVNATQTKPALFMPGDTYTGSALTLYAVYRWCEGNTGSDTYYFTFIVDGKTYCITRKHSTYARFVVEEATSGLIFGIENDYLYYLDENGVKNYVYYEGSSTTVTTTTTYPNSEQYKTTFVDAGDGTTIVKPAINNNRTLQFTGTGNLSDDYDRAYYTTGGTNPTLVEIQSSTCTYATNPTCYTNTNLHFVTNGGTLNYPTNYDETDYQELAPGSTVFLPTATFAGEWTFEGWKRGSQLESQTIKPYDPSFYPVTLNSTQFEVDDLGDIYFYAVYSKTNDDKQFDPVNGGTYKLFAIGADGTKTYMPVWTGTRGTPSGVTTCAETGDYTITPGTGTHAGQHQITCGEYTLGVVSGNTDLNKVEGTWWNIEPSTSGKGTWRITVAGSTDDRALSCSFSTAKSFGNYAISNLNNPSQSIYRDMEIGECIYTEYTSTPENIPYITITGAPVKITSTNGERVYASTTVHIEAHNFTGERIIHLSATNGFGVDPAQVRTNGQGAYSGNVKVYYEPTTDGDGQTITTSVLTASQTGGTNAEKISQTFAAIQGRNMPANFVIAAKWDGHWYALPANCTLSLSSTEGLLIEVNDMNNPTIATAAPASAKYGLREVIPSRQTDHGQGIVFTERFAEGDKQFALYNGSDANIQVNAQYSNYAQTNPDKYEWIPSTSDFKDYTLTNASTGRNLGLTTGTFGAYTAASNQVRLLPATFYEPATTQVLKWKANSVIVMYTGAEATATTQVGDNDQSDEQILADQKLTHGIYELTTDQALTTNAGGTLSLYFGANTRVELEIPLIISGEVTASANAHDVVILENSKLTAATTKYSYKDVYVYGGGKLAIPDGAQLGVNNIILRAGGVATDGAGQNATYQYIYPQVELKGTLTSAVQNIRYEYVTDNDHWYHLVLPFDGSLASIHYPYEYYGDQVKLDNKGSWIIKRYDGATRATGNYDAWVDIETEGKTSTTAGQGYIFWGAPKKVTANGAYERPKWGIQRITMLSKVSETINEATKAEKNDKTVSGLSSHKDVPNNSGAVNDQGWNLIGNPYMVNLTGLNSESLKPGKLVEVEDAAGNWTGQWKDNEDGFRYVTIPSDHFDTYTAQRMTAFTEANPMIAGRAFFIQLEDDDAGVTFSAANRASLLAARVAANEPTTDIETGIVLSNETMQDEVNFWIKDGKTNDYEYNADYPKTPNNNHFNIYGVHTNGDLSWVATGPEFAKESMPIGYQVPDAGTYMLSVSEEYYSDEIDALYVTDHEMSPEVTTDLMIAPYEFSVNQAETNNMRFTVSIKLKKDSENDATGLDNININGEEIQKFIYQDKMYILYHGIIYDATGKRVITINK